MTDQLVYPFSNTNQFLGNSPISQYIERYLTAKEAKTIIVEQNYIDKDYLIDYSKFYSRSFNVDKKYTTRVHFFDNTFNNDEFNEILISGEPAKIKNLKDHYLGFSVVKPIKNRYDHDLIGKTLLKPYPDIDGEFNRKYLGSENAVSLFGINLSIFSAPYQTQDSTVGGCATIACWIAIQQLAQKYELGKLSPYEITEKTVHIPKQSRNFPSYGLTMEQIKAFFNACDLETEFIMPSIIAESEFYDKLSDDFVSDAVKAYLELDIPIVVGIALKRKEPEIKGIKAKILYRLKLKKTIPNFNYHAVVVTGYKTKNQEITELYLHDDGIGPYCKTFPKNNFDQWDNEWLNNRGYSEIIVNTLLIPLYPKIRLPFKLIYNEFLKQKRDFETFNQKNKIPKSAFGAQLFLMDIQKYKGFLIDKSFTDKLEIITKSFPRFLWIIRHSYSNKPVFDVVYDATNVYANEPFQVIAFNDFH